MAPSTTPSDSDGDATPMPSYGGAGTRRRCPGDSAQRRRSRDRGNSRPAGPRHRPAGPVSLCSRSRALVLVQTEERDPPRRRESPSAGKLFTGLPLCRCAALLLRGKRRWWCGLGRANLISTGRQAGSWGHSSRTPRRGFPPGFLSAGGYCCSCSDGTGTAASARYGLQDRAHGHRHR